MRTLCSFAVWAPALKFLRLNWGTFLRTCRSSQLFLIDSCSDCAKSLKRQWFYFWTSLSFDRRGIKIYGRSPLLSKYFSAFWEQGTSTCKSRIKFLGSLLKSIKIEKSRKKLFCLTDGKVFSTKLMRFSKSPCFINSFKAVRKALTSESIYDKYIILRWLKKKGIPIFLDASGIKPFTEEETIILKD